MIFPPNTPNPDTPRTSAGHSSFQRFSFQPVTLHFPALISAPTAVSAASLQKQIPSNKVLSFLSMMALFAMTSLLPAQQTPAKRPLVLSDETVELIKSTTLPTFKTYKDLRNGNEVNVDTAVGFLYRNPGTGNLESVLKEGSGTLPMAANITSYGNGLPASQAANFTNVQSAETGGDWVTVKAADTGQTLSYSPSDSFVAKNAVTGQWESRYREPARAPTKANSSGSTLGQQIANSLVAQLQQALQQAQQNNQEFQVASNEIYKKQIEKAAAEAAKVPALTPSPIPYTPPSAPVIRYCRHGIPTTDHGMCNHGH